MKRFTRLYMALDSTTKTGRKIDALVEYFEEAPPEDASWAVYFLMGEKVKRAVNTRRLREWVSEYAGLPLWLIEECYERVGDLAETIAHLIPHDSSNQAPALGELVNQRLLPMPDMEESGKKDVLFQTWCELDRNERFVWNKLITGGFRVGVSRLLLTRALAERGGVDKNVLAHRLMGAWEPSAENYLRLFEAGSKTANASAPYPFFLASPLENGPEALGPVSEWSAEWKWDGIRAQAIKRMGHVWLWSRGEELVTQRYPEIAAAMEAAPDGTVFDGEILAWRDGSVLPFHQLQKRIGRKTAGKKILADVPVVLMIYDLLEWEGRDIREEPLEARRALLDGIPAVNGPEDFPLRLSPLLEGGSWEALAAVRGESRANAVEGLMLKRADSPYRAGRTRGDWWKWKIDPFRIDAVLIYAQRGHGSRAGLYTDYTFAVWNEERELVPIAKAYSGLSAAEIRRVDQFVRRNTLDRFGPVRVVRPELVFELHFEGIQRSPRHKSGVALRFPRMARQRDDKSPAEADTLQAVKALLESHA